MNNLSTPKQIKNFKDWLCSHGAEILALTNEYEVVRFRAGAITSVVYKNTRGKLSFVGEARKAYVAFTSSNPYKIEPVVLVKGRRCGVTMRTIRQRDGNLCFFCQKELHEDDQTREHLVAVIHGGPNHISNMFLAHKDCNSKAGNLSAPEKIKIHVEAVIKERYCEQTT